MSLQPLHADRGGALRLRSLAIDIARAIGNLFILLFISSLTAEERARQKATGEAPVFNMLPGEEPWPSCLFDQYWPR